MTTGHEDLFAEPEGLPGNLAAAAAPDRTGQPDERDESGGSRAPDEEPTHCPCGNTLPPRVPGVPGRRRAYCS
ncbi:hypothetical protein AB0J43_23035, partial [Nonomuraea fuscirosea]